MTASADDFVLLFVYVRSVLVDHVMSPISRCKMLDPEFGIIQVIF